MGQYVTFLAKEVRALYLLSRSGYALPPSYNPGSEQRGFVEEDGRPRVASIRQICFRILMPGGVHHLTRMQYIKVRSPYQRHAFYSGGIIALVRSR